ncbi:hypothetical protein CHLNCDRAFT_137165 [Chlorella variabilis]|uniref:Uncharacterized protein n=1 Tax=Chlorella variabilis TaxID=554065 RepID=E1ZLD9_CHLVA|nr:hypothetical protein CHLNCDRAFT_137165 [Chlorella variabilis]EFN53384.1 hypothetical protein CHLNCDRAFT_137165 [Chlorella variabilis]|eukprot:XP_005845486.1 hypothetical protein CHLNCDRAFT_137165 [Chlorella variabilis]
MDMSTRQKLAELIQKDIDQLREKAEGQGVTAWLTRPVQRERPNERFLISTLRGVQAHNRRAEEEEMWERYQQRRQREEGEQGEAAQRQRGHSSGHAEEGGHVSDDAIAAMVASKRSRGRGGVGSRMDVPGPYLPSGETAELANDDTELVRRQQLGPARPEWLQRQEQEQEERELIAMGEALQQRRRGKKQRRRGDGARSGSGSSSSSGGGSGGSSSDSSAERRRRKRRRSKKEKKVKKKRRKQKRVKEGS